MCFYYSSQTTKQIAQEDILVYKECQLKKTRGNYYLIGKFFDNYTYTKRNWSPIKHASLHRGKKYITQGLHSNINRCRYSNTMWIIPRGSIYYKNENEYVSNSLEFVSFITKPYVDELVTIDCISIGTLALKELLQTNTIKFKRITLFSSIKSIFKFIL